MPRHPVPGLAGRVIVVTGAGSGIGRAAAVELARRGGELVLVDRDRLAGVAALVHQVAGRAPTVREVDFARLKEVHRLADDLAARYRHIAVLANNAGTLQARRVLTVDGHELTIQTNHLAGFLLANLLREQLRGGRVVTTSSLIHRTARIDPADLDGQGRRYRMLAAYARSKLANTLFTAEAARRWADVCAIAVHPGIVRTRLGAGSLVGLLYRFGGPILATPEQGADTLVWLAGAPVEQLTSGAYYVRRRVHRLWGPAADSGLAARVWEASVHAVGLDTHI